ncbi:MAG: hypothetical protein SFU56_00395 [Capsulimonadales bacterium]|nr:hypothetical protein [Capsulimonadales bacterium]
MTLPDTRTTSRGTAPLHPTTAIGGDEITIRITFTDGSEIALKSVVQLGEEFTTASRMNELINANLLAFDVDGHTMLFPVSSIRFIEISPALKIPNLLIHSAFTLVR